MPDAKTMPWSERFQTGHSTVDAEHRELLRQLAAVRSALDEGQGGDKVAELIAILQRYAVAHFAHEEAHMLQVRCSAHSENCTAHREFIRRLDGWLELLTFGSTPISVLRDIQQQSTAWIEDHIVRIDCRLRGCPLK